ncbi:hypothetical protein BDA96_02G190400 [Sorghum bicolor]|uniref:Uncharacterized protein n=2 Tax=Sorghum bicolor TaxID=4558 RepID=A0A921UT11_SORBI|nr:hypothetical protein BDA96_02G190400 [Sorghum bicolor]OQU89361.1 hypothetical protein SORBI_3002G180501 [Sorghum bicolor]
MAPADGSRCAHRALGLLRVPGQGRRQAGHACRRRIPPHAAAAALLSLWCPASAWGQQDRVASMKRIEHLKPRYHARA